LLQLVLTAGYSQPLPHPRLPRFRFPIVLFTQAFGGGYGSPAIKQAPGTGLLHLCY